MAKQREVGEGLSGEKKSRCKNNMTLTEKERHVGSAIKTNSDIMKGRYTRAGRLKKQKCYQLHALRDEDGLGDTYPERALQGRLRSTSRSRRAATSNAEVVGRRDREGFTNW